MSKKQKKDVDLCAEDILRTSDRVQWQRREPTTSENRDQRDHARIGITPVMIRIRKQHRTMLLVRDLTRYTEQPLFRDDTSSREPRRVQIQHGPMPMRVRMRMRSDESQSRYVMRRRGDAEQCRLHRARLQGQRGLG